jgi:AcrR family transcriptional regulator
MIFDRDGFAVASMSAISDAAGVTKGALYFHFVSKEELVGAVQLLGCELLEQRSAELLAREESPLQTVVDLMYAVATLLESSPVVRACMRTARECADRGSPFVGFHEALGRCFGEALVRAGAARELKWDLAPEAVHTQVIALCVGLEVLWCSKVVTRSRADTLDQLWEILLPSVAAPGRSVRLGGSVSLSS